MLSASEARARALKVSDDREKAEAERTRELFTGAVDAAVREGRTSVRVDINDASPQVVREFREAGYTVEFCNDNDPRDVTYYTVLAW